MNNILKVTEKATNQLKKIIDNAPPDTVGVMVGIDKSGCSGYSYKLDFAKSSEVSNFECIKKDGAKQETANILKKASEDLAAQGSKVQLLACSEFSLLSATLQRANCHIIDTLDVLTQAVIETSMVV